MGLKETLLPALWYRRFGALLGGFVGSGGGAFSAILLAYERVSHGARHRRGAQSPLLDRHRPLVGSPRRAFLLGDRLVRISGSSRVGFVNSGEGGMENGERLRQVAAGSVALLERVGDTPVHAIHKLLEVQSVAAVESLQPYSMLS
jgi:hypothetical protein